MELDGLKSWVSGAFMNANHFPLLHLNPSQDYPESKSRHSIKLVWLQSFFLHGLKFWVRAAFWNADAFPRFDLNQDRDCHELHGSH
jgi:hypothetical protein